MASASEKQKAVAAAIAKKGVEKHGAAKVEATVKDRANKAGVSSSKVKDALSRAGVSSSSGSLGTTSGAGVETSGKYAGLTPQQRQQAVAADIAARGKAKHGEQAVSDTLAVRGLDAVEDGRADPATVSNAFNRAGIPEHVALASIEKALAAKTLATPDTIVETVAPEIVDVTPQPDVATAETPADETTGNIVTDLFGDLQDGIFGEQPAEGSTPTTPAPSTRVVSSGLAWLLGLALIAGLFAALVKKFRKRSS